MNTNIERTMDETLDPAKPFGFAAIADTVSAEITAAETKRDEDRKFVRSIINDVAGTMGIKTIDRFNDDEIRNGLSSRSFASYSEDIRHSIMRIVQPKIDDSKALRDHMHIISNACRISMTGNGNLDEWEDYLSTMCPDAMERIRKSSCQFKDDAKRSLTFIAIRLELDALKKTFVPLEVSSDDDDDLY